MDYFDDLSDEDLGLGPKKRRTDSPEDAVRRVAVERGYNPDYLWGLARLETRGGDATIKGAGEDSRNLFNIKDFSRAGTGMQAFDKAEGSNDRYRRYASYDESVEDLVSLLDRKYPGAREAQDPLQFAQVLKDGGYATDPKYVDKLSRTIGSSPRAKPTSGGTDYFSGLSGDGVAALNAERPVAPRTGSAQEDKPWYNDAYEVARQGVAGAVVDVPRAVGMGLRRFAPDGSSWDQAGREMVEAADARAPGWAPDNEGRGWLPTALAMGARSIPRMLPAIGATVVGGPGLGAAVGAVSFGAPQAQETEDKLRMQGVDDSTAFWTGVGTGALQGVGEAAATYTGMKLATAASPAIRTALGMSAKNTAGVASELTNTSVLGPLAKGLGLNLLVQPATEVVQDVGTELIERAGGAAPEDALAIAADSAQGAVGMTLLLGPFAGFGQIQRARSAAELKQALMDPAVPDMVRAQARDVVAAEAERQGVAAQDIDGWLDQQFMADDDRARVDASVARDRQLRLEEMRALDERGELARQRGVARDLVGQWNPEEQPSTQAIIDERTGVSRTPVAPKGYARQFEQAAQEPSGVVVNDPETGTERQLSALEVVQRGLPPEPQPSPPPTPQQQRVQAIKERAAQVAQNQQQVQARAGEFGVTKPAALATYADLESALDEGLIDDNQFADAAGMLAGNAPGLAKVRKTLADIRKVAQLQAEQTQRLEEADAAQRAKDLEAVQKPAAKAATNTQGVPADVPTTAQPGAQTSQAPGAQAAPQGQAPAVVAPKTVVVGRKGRQKALTKDQLADKFNAAPKADKLRIADLFGMELTDDPDTGAPVLVVTSEPRTFDEVARRESARTGKTVTRQAIQQAMAKYGINQAVVDAAVGAYAESVSAEALGIDPEADGSGFRVEGDLSKAAGQGLVQTEEDAVRTPEQRAAKIQADQMLKRDAADRARMGEQTEDAPVFPEGAVVTDLRDGNPARIEENIRRSLAGPEAAHAAADWDSDIVTWGDLPRTLKADWIDLYTENLRQNEGELDFERLSHDQRNIERDFDRLAQAQQQAPAGPAAVGNSRAGGRLPGADAGAWGQPGRVAGRVAPAVLPGPASIAQADAAQDAQPQPGQDADADGAEPEVVVGNNGNFDPANPDIRFNTLPGQFDKAGQPVAVIPQTIDSMERTPAIKEVFDSYRKRGLGHLLGTVQDWHITRNVVGWGGAYARINGRPTIIMSMQDMMVPDNAIRTMHHELGHAVDLVVDGGLFSGAPEFNLRIVGNEVRAHGIVSNELLEHFEQNPDSPLAEHLKYPLDRTKYGDLDAQGIREELFAQIWAVYNTRSGREFLEDNLPDTAYFMEKVDETIRQDDYRAEIDAIWEAEPAAQEDGQLRFNASGQGADRQVPGRAQGVLRTGSSGQVALPPAARSAQAATAKFFKDVKDRAVLWGAFTKDLAAAVADKLPSVTRYIALVDEAQVAKTRAERKVEAVLDLYRTLPAHERGTGPGSVNAYLKASTMGKVWGYVPEYVPGAKVDPAMAERFDKLSPKAQSLVREVFKHGHDNLLALKRAVEENVSSEFDALIAGHEAAGDTAAADQERKAKAKALRDFQSLQALQGDWPYAPLKRFGNHVVVGMSQAYMDAEESGSLRELERLKADEAHYYVAFAETQREARSMREKIAGRYAYSDNFERDKAHDMLYGGRDVLGAFRRLRDLVDNTQDEHLKGAANKALNRLMTDLHLTLLGEQSARQAERQRIGVAGADDDMMRAFATQGRATAHFIAGLQNNGRIQDELHNMRREADARVPGREDRRAAFNEVLRRHAMGLDYQPTPLIDRAMGASSVWMLLTSPAYFLTNATQPWVMTLPVLAGRHGYARSSAALFKAYQDILPLVKDGTVTQEDYTKMPDDVRGIVQALADSGAIDISLEQDLGRWRSTEDKALRHITGAVDRLRGVAQTVESINRLTTAIAAARLAGLQNPAAAKDYAQKVIYDTHGDYSGFNAPRVMRTGVGRLVTQFRKFQLIQLSLYAKLISQSLKGATQEERTVARSALAWSMGHMFALGGLLGMPGAQFFGWLLRQVFGDDDEPDNPELTLRKLVPEELADLLTKGAPKAMGLDLSGRVGAGGMLSLLPYADTSLDRKGYETAVMAMLGPMVGGLLPRMADGVGLIGQGQVWRGLEQLLPKGFTDVSKAVRQGTQGVTQRNGDVVLTPDDLNLLDNTLQAIGLPTTTLTDRGFRANAKYQTEEFYKERTTKIKRAYVEAYRSGDQAELAEARKDWERLQENRVSAGFKRQPWSDLVKAPMEQRRREQNTAGGVQFTRRNEGFVRELARE